MASTVYPVALSHFAVFCPALGPDEDNTHEQLLFYAGAVLPPFYPGERVVSLDMKLREIGLAAALVTFGNSFGTNKSKFHVVHSEKRRTVVFEPERGVLMQLSVVLPRRVRPYAGGSSKEKDAYSIEFLDSELSDEAMRAWVESEYWAFRILFGPLSRALNSGSGGGGEQQKQTVRRQLDAFFGRTLWRWDRRWRSELDLIHALRPLPQMPLGSISLGGFEQLWRALSELLPPPPSPPASDDCAADDERRPLVAAAVVLWRGREVLWSSCGLAAGGDQIHVLRALAAWSRAALAPAFSGGPPPSRRPRAAANPITPSASASVSASVSASMPATATGGSSSWLWGWRAKPDAAAAAAATPKLALHTSGSAESCSAESSSGDGSDDGGGAGGGAGGGIAQALSRAVNALVEPRPPTPPEVDPVFASTCEAGQYALSASDIADSNHERRWASSGGGALFADSDAESLRSVSSVQTTRTAATVAVSRHSASARMEPALSAAGEGRRTRSTTVQSSSAAAPPYAQAASRSAYWPMALGRGGLAQRAHGRSPSIMSTASIATVESTQLRDDTRVSARSWWPSVLGGSWGSSAAKMPEPAPLRTTAPLSDDSADEPQSALLSGIDVSTTFLYTGEHAFPGLSAAQPSAAAAAEPQPQQPLQHSNGAEYIRVVEGGGEEDDDDEEPQGERREATVSRLESAMDEGMPAAYAHGVDVDPERGVVLAPRGLSGMQYDTRLLKLMFQGTSDIPTTAPERPLYVSPDSQDGACKTLVYKYGDFVFQ
ncbi:hypothetical protein GGI00_000015 [Coemansia sp. RSA 2681]|nr:hypothetical protein GGI00_000015 [Coemansia sp. RSA 2681]